MRLCLAVGFFLLLRWANGLAGLLWLFIYLSWPICPLCFSNFVVWFRLVVCAYDGLSGRLSQFGSFSFKLSSLLQRECFYVLNLLSSFPFIPSFFITISIVFHLSFLPNTEKKKNNTQCKQSHKDINMKTSIEQVATIASWWSARCAHFFMCKQINDSFYEMVGQEEMGENKNAGGGGLAKKRRTTMTKK